MSLLQHPGAIPVGDTGYDVDNSVRFDGNAVLARTPSSGGNRRTWTWSCWLKKCKNATRQEILSVNGATNNDDHMSLRFDSDDKFTFAMYSRSKFFKFTCKPWMFCVISFSW